LLFFAPLTLAKNIANVEMPDIMEISGQPLVLNGVGLRKKFVIKLYAAGLYLKNKSKDANAVINADDPMVVRMHFLYQVSGNQLVSAWNESFESNLETNRKATLQNQIGMFNDLFSYEAKKDDIYEVIYEPGKGIHVKFNGEVLGTVPGLDFKKAVFSIWFSMYNSDPDLKKAMMDL